MTREDFDDETLMAFADGELDEATSAQLETALAADDGLAARLAVFLDTRRTRDHARHGFSQTRGNLFVDQRLQRIGDRAAGIEENRQTGRQAIVCRKRRLQSCTRRLVQFAIGERHQGLVVEVLSRHALSLIHI